MLFAALSSLPALGQNEVHLVDIGGHRLFLDCSGPERSPVVVFEAGSGRTSEDWSSVQREISKSNRACSYDRAGLGKSDHVVGTETAAGVVQDLHRLLLAAGIPAPYILVGHSQGGMFVRRYTTGHPSEVVGMVLVDSAHEEQFWRVAAISSEWADRIGQQFSASDMAQQGFLPANEHLVWHFDIPLVVVEHGMAQAEQSLMSQQSEAVFRDLQQDLASRSKFGEVRKARTTGYYIQIDEPDLVTQAIKDVIRQAQMLAASRITSR